MPDRMLLPASRFQNRPRKKQCRRDTAFFVSRSVHANPRSMRKKFKIKKCYFEGSWYPMAKNEVKRQAFAWHGSELLMLAAEPTMDSH